MNPSYNAFLQRTIAIVVQLLDLLGTLDQLNSLWAGSPSYQTLITQAQINLQDQYAAAGLTTQNVADAEYALATIKTTLENALVALSVLANIPH